MVESPRLSLAASLLALWGTGTLAGAAGTVSSGAGAAPVVAAAAAADAAPAAAAGPADPLALRIRHGFTDSPYGQVHYLSAQPEPALPRRAWKTPLVMFHQSPLSAREFAPLIAEMGRDRVVIALDTPGQGLSDGPDRIVTIADYALVLDAALGQLGFGKKRPVDVFANHTGVWIAGEIAICNPSMIRRIVLNGVYVVPEDVWRANVARVPLQDSSAAFFQTMATDLPRARQYYLDRGMSDADWGRMVVGSLTPLQRREYGHVAAFRYAADAPARLPLISQPVTLLLIDDGIADRTRGALPLFRNVTKVIEHLDWKEGLFYTRPAEVAAVLRESLD